MRLIMVDLDGTLIDTRKVNYYSYLEAVKTFGYSLDYEYYCECCNGRHYLDFLPQITTRDEKILSKMHHIKEDVYPKYIGYARLNTLLLELLRAARKTFRISLVTTASKKNTYDILRCFDIVDDFDLILTHDDILNSKPNPEGYIKAMNYFEALPKECLIFEDSDVGIAAAANAGVQCYIVTGYR